VTLIDTPGLSFPASASFASRTPEGEVQRAVDALLRARGRLDRMHDPLPALAHVVARLAAPEDLMLFYALPAFAPGDSSALLAALARTQGFVGKKGVLDKAGAARVLLRDWATGRLPRVAVAPVSVGAELGDAEVLERLRTRAEMRKGDGLVRLTPGMAEAREVDLAVPWVMPDPEGDDSDAEMDDGEGEDGEGEDDDDDDDDDEQDEDDEHGEGEDEDEEEEAAPPPSSLSSKRKAASAPSRPAKKVAFDLPSKGKGKDRRVTAPAPKVKARPAPAKTPAASALKRTGNAPKAKAKAAAPAADDNAYSFGAFFK
jgi:nuclear GTP-binding protein